MEQSVEVQVLSRAQKENPALAGFYVRGANVSLRGGLEKVASNFDGKGFYA